MKIILVSTTLLVLIYSTAFAELTKGDLEEIRSIVKEEVGEVEVRLNLRMDNLDSRMDGLDSRMNDLNTRIDDLRAELKDDITSSRAEVKDDIASLKWMVGIMLGALAAIVAASLALPWIIGRTDVKELRERVVRLETQLEGR